MKQHIVEQPSVHGDSSCGGHEARQSIYAPRDTVDANRERGVAWCPGMDIPSYANRKTLAAIISFYYFPVSHRTIATWPLTVRRPNREAILSTAEALNFAKAKFEDAHAYKQAEG